jgi:ribokinase
MGSDGAFIVDESVARHVPAMQVEAIDTTGAGDAFAAALSVFLCEGCSLHEAALQATVVSAITVTRLGTHASFPQRSEVEKRLLLTH